MQSMVQARLQDSAVVGKQAGASSPGELEALKQELQKVLLWKENTESTFGTMSEQVRGFWDDGFLGCEFS